MSNKVNLSYLETYSQLFAEKVCADYFGTKQYMDGQEIIRLTPISQVNLMVIKSLFGAWQEELEKLKSNPYFDYHNHAASEALKEFMNVLSRSIKIEKPHFEPLLSQAVKQTVLLAVDPVEYFLQEIERSPTDGLATHFKEVKKYLKWHPELLGILGEKAAKGASSGELERALKANYEYLKNAMEPAASLLSPFDQIHPLQLDELLPREENASPVKEQEPTEEDKQEKDKQEELVEEKTIVEEPTSPRHTPAEGSRAIDPALAWAKFESEEYKYMKGSVGPLSESIGINQKFMFTKVLFEGNNDLMVHALNSVENCENFVDAIEFLNQHYVAELDWDIDSDEVGEFLQLIFRKFDHSN